MEFELSYNDVIVQHVSPYFSEALQTSSQMVNVGITFLSLFFYIYYRWDFTKGMF